MEELVGIVLWNKDYGYCKVLDINPRTVTIQFCGTDRTVTYAIGMLGKDLLHKVLPLESYASVEGKGICQLIKVPPPGKKKGFFRYVVRFEETGDTAELSERELVPRDAHPKETLFSRMESCDPHALYKVIARHQFLLALEDLHKETGGLEALIGSRIELFPHQAFVAGTVINDSVRRFILADEVGLGKTVEAGLIINDLLSVKPDARVLILAPGALSRQWLCELHMSFGSQGFRLADLYKTLDLNKWQKVICSITRATFAHRHDFEPVSKWDLLIVDEAHHLLWSPEAYQLVENLSHASNGLLLLSAVPARKREDELLRLLRLLDPERYRADKKIAQRFTELYRAQPLLGRGLRILDRDLTAIETGNASPEDLEFPLSQLLKVTVLSEDTEVKELCRDISKMPQDQALLEARRLRDVIVDRYRLSRRVIKNRRSQLISQELLQGVNREYELLSYEADGFENETWLAIESLLKQIVRAKVSVPGKHLFFKLVYSSMSDPVCASLLADELTSGLDKKARSKTINLFTTSYETSYDEYYDFLKDVSDAVCPHLDADSVTHFSNSVNAWIDAPSTKRRLARLLESLQSILACTNKLIIFAGAFGTAAPLAEELKTSLGDSAVEVFTYDLEDAEKEQAVLRFRTQDSCRILVSDETGGEGRNFQFVDAIIHYDLPWSVAAIEQRVGRLDRIGRITPVKSYLLYQTTSIEEGFVSCLINGFKVFTSSISGLEFMLRDTEAAMIDTALSLDWEQLALMGPQIAEASDTERRIDDAEALTDAGSFPAFGGMRFLREISDTLEQRLENCFVAYFRSLAQQGSVRQYADDQQPNLQLWRLRPDEIRNDPLPGLNRGADGLFTEHRGTFRRLVARERRKVEFFSVGNPLFDSVASVALERLSGRVFAIGVRDSDVEAGHYLVMGMRCAIAPNSLGDEVPLQRRVNRYFFGKRLDLIYRLGETDALDLGRLEDLIHGALNGTRPSTNLAKDRFYELIQSEVPDWTDYLSRLRDVAFDDTRKAYRGRFGFDHDSLINALRRERSELERSPTSLGRDTDALKILESAFESWEPVVDIIGILQVSV